MTSLPVQDGEYLFAWDQMTGIVSVWAHRDGRVIIWRRVGERVVCLQERYYPWVLATSLIDLSHLGPTLQPLRSKTNDKALIRYRELTGPIQCYRFLLLACEMRVLEQALLKGAIRRLRRPCKHLSELEDEYYYVGPVEQYLMSSGRVYFRGMNYEDLHRLQFDLETTALDPHQGRIFLVAVRDSRGLATLLEAPQPQDEPRLITDLCQLIRARDPDVIENHNLFGFDLPFLEHRALVHGIALELGRDGGPKNLASYQETLAVGPEMRKRTRYSVAGRELIDTLDAVRRYDYVVRNMPSHGLKDVACYLGLASPERTYIEGADIFETYRHDPERVRRYAFDDVLEVDGISCRLLGAPFALAQMAPRRYERLASAGPATGVLEPMLVRSYLRMGAALPYRATLSSAVDGLHEGGAVHLFAEGIAQQIVKADVASLYPSLMRTFQIGPTCDHLGVLLSILAHLTDLRLEHKAAARRARPNSSAANRHQATQVAMKILINAAYGYMGAGSLALFADGRAAAEVTRRGRQILTQVLDALRQRGMVLIEADTDGVYFAVPHGWTEPQERALVSEIGANLPPGIHLEYEGRYQAMLSHEVKNYALLTYDDQLIVHGVALRSSRAEPYGERFLRQALHSTLIGDIQRVRELFLSLVSAIRNRELPVSDLARRVRLSKTPEAYLHSRMAHQEGAYEALISAGRRHWLAGERIRYYRSRKKAYVWLPEEIPEAPVADDWRARAAGDDITLPVQKLPTHAEVAVRRDYDIDHYVRLLVTSYAARLRKAFAPDDFERLFSLDTQLSLFESEQSIEQIEPHWIRCDGGGGLG